MVSGGKEGTVALAGRDMTAESERARTAVERQSSRKERKEGVKGMYTTLQFLLHMLNFLKRGLKSETLTFLRHQHFHLTRIPI